MKIKEIIKVIDNLRNPYPEDVFPWDSKGNCKAITRGRFNHFIHQVVENTKEDIKEALSQLPQKKSGEKQ